MGAGSPRHLRLDPRRAGRGRALPTHLAQGGDVPAVPVVTSQTCHLPFPEEARDRVGSKASGFAQHLSLWGRAGGAEGSRLWAETEA